MRAFLALSLCVLLSGCAVEHGRLTAITTKNADLSQYDKSMIAGKNDVEGESVQSIIIFWPTGPAPRLDNAVEDALNKGGGNVLINAVGETSSWYIPLIYGRSTWRVRGIPVLLPEAQ